MKVLVTCVYDAKDAEDAAHISRSFPSIGGSLWTRTNLDKVDKGILMDECQTAALAHWCAIEREEKADE